MSHNSRKTPHSTHKADPQGDLTHRRRGKFRRVDAPATRAKSLATATRVDEILFDTCITRGRTIARRVTAQRATTSAPLLSNAHHAGDADDASVGVGVGVATGRDDPAGETDANESRDFIVAEKTTDATHATGADDGIRTQGCHHRSRA